MRWTGWVTVAAMALAAAQADASCICDGLTAPLTLTSVQVAGVAQADLSAWQGWQATLDHASVTGFELRIRGLPEKCAGCGTEEFYAPKP